MNQDRIESEMKKEQETMEDKKRKQRIQLLVMGVLLAAVLGGGMVLYQRFQNYETETPPEPVKEERVLAPDFTVTDGEGTEVSLSSLKGKPVVVNFWASWCPPCKSEMPGFETVSSELGERVHFMMIDAVDGRRETVESGSAYIAGQGFTFPVYYDIGQQAITQYGVRAFPSTLFIDAEGYIVSAYEGAMNEAALRQEIQLLTGSEGIQSLSPSAK